MSENRLPRLPRPHSAGRNRCAQLRGRDGQGRLLGRQAHPAGRHHEPDRHREAATKVMDGYVEFTQAHADVPWRSMRNMRNRMAHGYFDINLDVVWETYRNGCRRCSSNCPPCVRMPTMKTVTTTVKEGSPMTVESRIFSVAEYVQPSEGEPIRSVVLETRDSIIVVWHVHPGQEIAAHIHPHGQDTWTVLSGMADYFQGNGLFVPSGKVR
ncbi:Protein of uncharacterised function DUF86 [Escherichia coli]|uniref:Protein of uncharacterized function DUF86 n=1 Tax=Escherichia coli TaxID=562 RepID=A0A377BET5_ECOLX|nr:Protein of uncharacterised function DUF86 [Escherichia coli]